MKYKIRIDNQLVEVSEEMYREYYRMQNHEDYLARRDREKGLAYYHALDGDGVLGADIIQDESKDILGDVLKKEERTALEEALNQLKQRDRQLIEELYFNERTEHELAKMLGVRQQTIHEKKVRILRILRKIIKI